MRLIGVVLAIPALLVIIVLASLPAPVAKLIELALIVGALWWVDEQLTRGAGRAALGWAGRKLWGVAHRRFRAVPAPPAGPAPVPLARRYYWIDPVTGRSVYVDIPPAAVYDYHDNVVHEYVGKTVNTDIRHEQHTEDGRTFVGLPRDVQWYPCECVALAVERAAIRAVAPVQNIAHNGAR